MPKITLSPEQQARLEAQKLEREKSAKAQLSGKYVPSALDTSDCFEYDMTVKNFEDQMHSDAHNQSVNLTAMFFESLESVATVGDFKATPDDGDHLVVIKEFEVRAGRNGQSDYILFTLRDELDCRTWSKIVGINEMQATFDEINSNNKQMLGVGVNGKTCLNILQRTPFKVWTVEDKGKNKLLTYFDESRYSKYIYWMRTRSEKQELKPASAEDGDVTQELPWSI